MSLYIFLNEFLPTTWFSKSGYTTVTELYQSWENFWADIATLESEM